MRTDLSPEFIAELSKDGRYPYQYLVFHFPDGDITVSDAELLGRDSLVIVEDWGQLTDVVNVDDAIKGNGSPTRQMTVSLFNTREYGREAKLLPNGEFKDWAFTRCPDEWSLVTDWDAFSYRKANESGGLRGHSDTINSYDSIIHTLAKPIGERDKVRIDVEYISPGAQIYVINSTNHGSTKITEAGIHDIYLTYTPSATLSIGGYNDLGTGYEFVINSISIEYYDDIYQDVRTPFASLFNIYAPENISVSLYQCFIGIADEVLIGKFLVQDPIKYSESSALLSLDLVSQNQYADPFVGTLDQVTNTYPDVIIGPNEKVLGVKYGDWPLTYLKDASNSHGSSLVTSSTVGLDTIGFPDYGHIIVDFELFSYDWLEDSGVGFKDSFGRVFGGQEISSGYSARMVHKSGTPVILRDFEYLYSFGAGPVESLGPVYIGDDIYTGSRANFYPDRNPVQIGFVEGPPYITTLGDTFDVSFTVSNDGSYNTSMNMNRIDDCSYEFSYSFAISGQAAVYSGQDVGRCGLTVDYKDGYSHGSFGWGKLLFRSGSVWSYDNNWRTAIYYNDNHGGGDVTINWPSTSNDYNEKETILTISRSAMFYGATIHFRSLYDTRDNYIDPHGVTAYLLCLKASMEFTPYQREFAPGDITADINTGTGTGPVRPVEAIKTMLARIGVSQFIDQTSYDEVYDIEVAKNYTFSALLKGDRRCRETIKDMCMQSRTTLIYNAGLIKFAYRYTLDELIPPVRFVASPANTQLKSISIVRQNVSDIVNRGTIFYNPIVAEGEYQGSITREIVTSIEEFGLHEEDIEGYLIDNGYMAQEIIDYLVDESSFPYMVITFNLYLDAFALEPEDIIQLNTTFSNLISVRCRAINIKRTFGAGKVNKINLFEVTCVAHYNLETITSNIIDTVSVSDSIKSELKKLTLTMVGACDSEQYLEDGNGYGTGGYGQGGYGE